MNTYPEIYSNKNIRIFKCNIAEILPIVTI